MEKLFVGQKLKTTTNEVVTIERITETDIFISYRDCIYKRNKAIVGKKLFIIENQLKEHTCDNCMLLRKKDCFGAAKICNDFRYAPTISKEQLDNWPKYGDATYFKYYKKHR